MTEKSLPRKLAVILYADVAGYSRLTGEDEDATHRSLSRHLDLIAATVERHRGRVIHYAGDAVLASFGAVVDGLSCAARMQRELEACNRGLANERMFQFRIGVNLGDVIEDRGDIYGDGVNIAARLESLAEPGGVCISEAVRTAAGAKLPFEYEFLGEQEVKNIAQPLRAYRVHVDPDAEIAQPAKLPNAFRFPNRWRRERPLLLLCLAVIALAAVGALVWFNPVTPQSESVTGQQITVDRENIPSIAVLPFDNLSVDPEQGYFADGISEDLITDLSKIKHLFVIARNSSFAFKGKRADIADIAKELGVRYVLEGSVRRSGDRVRINAQLVDSHTLGHLWADRFERPVAEVFEFQDQVIRSIVDALSLELSSDEDRALFRPQTDSPEAYDAFLRGQSNFLRFTSEQIEEARILFRRAIELDPTFARAYSAMSVTYSNAVMNGAADDPDAAVEHAIDLARSAIALDSLLPQPHFALGYAFLYQREFEQAIQSVEGALARAPSYADAHMLLAFVLLHAGQVEKAFAHIELGKALNPQLSMEYLAIQGQAHYWAENYEEAADSLERALARNPAYALQRLYYAAVLINLDRLDEAEWEAQEALALNPSLSIAKWLSEQPFKDAAQSQRMAADLSRAGLE